MQEQKEYLSGRGKDSIIPPEIKGWSWGAFFWNWIWGIGNSTYIALLMFIPFVNLIMIFVLGAYGNKWAWQNRVWIDVEHFKRTQRKWAISGFLLFAFMILFISFILIAPFGLMKGEAYKMSLKTIRSNSEVIRLVGSPIEAGTFVLGTVSIHNSKGYASIEYSISGPKGKAEAYVSANRNMNEWSLSKVLVRSEELNTTILVVKPKK